MIKKPTMVLLVFMLLLAVVPTQVSASNDYYVATDGNDSNLGTIDHPFRTIQKGMDTASSGDTVFIRGGTYFEKISLTDKQATAWITVTAYRNEHVVVDGSGAVAYDGIFQFNDGCSYIRVSGLEIRNTGGHGIFLLGGEIDHIRFDNCTIHDCESSGIYCYTGEVPKYVRNVEFDYNTVYDVNNGLSYGTAWSPQEAISFSNVQGFAIHHNSLSKYGKEGIDCKSGCKDGSVHHNIIDNSLASPAFQWDYNHIGIYIDGYSRIDDNIALYCNDISGYGGHGICLNAEHPESGGAIQNIYVFNNMVDISQLLGHTSFRALDSLDDCGWANVFILFNTFRSVNPVRIFPSALNIQNLVIGDNIITSTTSSVLSFQYVESTEIEGRITLTNNLYFRYGGPTHHTWADGADKYWGENYIIADPLLSEDFHIPINSPAVNNGTEYAPVYSDFDGQSRPIGNGFDIGADEYDPNSTNIPGFEVIILFFACFVLLMIKRRESK